jgi:hypothetical protein
MVAGLLLVVTGLFFALSARALPMGSAAEMGPGYFPLILCALLVICGMLVIATSLKAAAAPGEPAASVPWRGLLLLAGSTILFGALVRPVGFGPMLAVVVFASSMASRSWRWSTSLVLTALVVAFGWVVFLRLLGLPIRFIGPWLL